MKLLLHIDAQEHKFAGIQKECEAVVLLLNG